LRVLELIRDKKIVVLEIIGTLFIIFLGTALHFTYAASGDNPVVGGFSAVNESVWEHLKLPFWPSIFWLLIIMYPLRNTVSNFFSAKAVGIVLMLVIIPAVFYTYTALAAENLTVDIATFMAAVIVGQVVSFALYKKTKRSRITEAAAVAVLVALAVMFVVFTWYPPLLPVFLDSETGQYGI
jgi:hypothetical protein